MSDETWTIAGAFVLGAGLGVIVTIRILRSVTEYFAGMERRRWTKRPPPRSGEEDDQ